VLAGTTCGSKVAATNTRVHHSISMHRHNLISTPCTQSASKFARFVRWAAALATCVGTTAAGAHALLVQSHPVANGLVRAGEVAIVLEFNTRIDKARSRVTVRSAQQAPAMVVTDIDDYPTRLSGRVVAATPGKWTLAWQVLARDGHITRGEVAFTVTDLPARP
jgi:methionine-rich copper-binding protein CopC